MQGDHRRRAQSIRIDCQPARQLAHRSDPQPPLAAYEILCQQAGWRSTSRSRGRPRGSHPERSHLLGAAGTACTPPTLPLDRHPRCDAAQRVCGAYSVEAGNVRHEHDLAGLEVRHAAERQAAHPGAWSADATNAVEHPRLVADRIVRYASDVGRENVIASTDCGLGGRIHPQHRLGEARGPGRGRRNRQQGIVALSCGTP